MAGENPNEPVPAEGAGEQGGAPETQVKPWWEARGFKSEGEALTSLDATRTELTETQQRLAEMDRTLKAVVTRLPETPAPETTPKPEAGYKRYYEGLDVEGAYASGDPHKNLEVFLAAVDRLQQERTVTLIERQENLREIRRAFFEENKDIAPYQDLVKMISQEVGTQFPQMTLGDAMKEVAKRVRSKVAAIKSGKEDAPAPGATGDAPQPKATLPHVGAGGSGDAPPAAGAPKVETPATDDVASEITRRINERGRKTALR